MYIKEICLEGFKSYATRTVVSGFDPFFNAITGLNGSGKSNILDSICFVLGITNLQQVRATSLQELVYKQGQAGITKATVSIVFDNSDRTRSPLGYEDCQEITVTRQIVVGGRNKYLINGHLAQPSRVQNLFHSVQLNVNNPHFLIMQGRITKAAGTRMYEAKKESALKTLEKKQSKVDEIDKLLDQEILPALEKLRKERMQYMQWANGNAELDRLRRFCIAYDYVQAEKLREGIGGRVEEIKEKIMDLDASTKIMSSEIQEMETKKVDAISRALVKETSVLSNREESLMTEKRAAEKIYSSIDEIKQSIGERESAVKRAVDGAADIKKNGGNDDKCLEDQLRDAKASVGDAETDQLMSKCEEAVAVENELNQRKSELEQIKATMGSIGYQDGQLEALQKERSAELEIVEKVKDEIRILSGQLANVEFTYRDPVKNFDRSKVKGVVAKLIKVKDSSTMIALEVAAGGKLFNVVVDTENTGKQLLQNGDLRRRVTIIPLNKIQSHIIPHRVQQAADRLVGDGNAMVAISLVGYDEEIKSAMAYVFGSSFVCRSTDAAKEVAFRKEVSTTSVTLEGDIFQPSGLLTGGSRRGGGELLRQLHTLAEAESKLQIHKKRLSDVEEKISQLLPLHKKFMKLKSQLDLKSYDLSLFQSRTEQNEHSKLGEIVKKLEQDLEQLRLGEKKTQMLYDSCVSAVSMLEKSITDHGTHREKRLNDLNNTIKTLKADLHSASVLLKEHENERQRLVMEKDASLKELASLENQLASIQVQIGSLTEEVNKQKAEVGSIKRDYDQAESELRLIRSKMKECDSEISAIVKEQQKLQQKISDGSVERKKMENEVKRMEVEEKDLASTVDRLLHKHSWIASERQLFGRSGTDYDFSSRDPTRTKEELEKLQSQQSGLEKRINKKVMAMFEKAEDEYNDLISKKNIIENDKSKIKMVIEELDEKKRETLKVTWVKVNKDFGSIFSTLLPGAMAKLEPPEGCSFLDGLEVRVAFGSVWKQSLSELSGGQRSLLALSLILALLLFKPAPLYILDEVDAALDLSHTQNIGRMIKSHFPHSQFVVVSLKEGMFNNANVLFRTKFIDGVSTVQRTATSI
ncbi:unnamed protein product [Spirodela intermedia]|uniref:SMC hinge domain-containing protein n=1 Tax=Spirodela intermedia TaxID=51605 RepID=A0A7I8IGF0_SPIIN|nr:unnamed protein product [Spirodela intermedia]CAA6656972.1 unnamed protein product [Spirodela intermedia]